jgi:hypothetical protein
MSLSHEEGTGKGKRVNNDERVRRTVVPDFGKARWMPLGLLRKLHDLLRGFLLRIVGSYGKEKPPDARAQLPAPSEEMEASAWSRLRLPGEESQVNVDVVIARLDELVNTRSHQQARILRLQIQQDLEALVVSDQQNK